MTRHCPFCDSDDLFETSEMTNVTNRKGELVTYNQEFTQCNECKEEFVSSVQARNNDYQFFNN